MDQQAEARLQLAAQRHPSSRAVGTLHFAQHRLATATRAFAALMSASGNPGSEPLPPPPGLRRWPRNHQARNVFAWPVPIALEEPFACWVDVSGRWWRLRRDQDGTTVDAHPMADALDRPGQLGEYLDALERLLRDHGVD